MDVLLTDLPAVVPLTRHNAGLARVAPGRTVAAAALAWGDHLPPPLPPPLPCGRGAGAGAGGGGADTGRGQDQRLWDFVMGCEILYWGGWDVFSEDTRGPLLATLCAAAPPPLPPPADATPVTAVPDCSPKQGVSVPPPAAVAAAAAGAVQTEVALAFTVRDKAREIGFVLDVLGGEFWLWLLREEVGDGGDEGGEGQEALDAAARAAAAAAAEGDLLLLGARRRLHRRR